MVVLGLPIKAYIDHNIAELECSTNRGSYSQWGEYLIHKKIDGGGKVMYIYQLSDIF